MLRRILTILSLVGLILSLGMWCLSFGNFRLGRIRFGHVIVQHNSIDIIEAWVITGLDLSGPPSPPPTLRGSRSVWLPNAWILATGRSVGIHVALWMPTIFFLLAFLFLCSLPPFTRRFRRETMGQATTCGAQVTNALSATHLLRNHDS